MPILKSTTAMTIFETVQSKAVTREALARYTFNSIDDTVDARSYGFVPFNEHDPRDMDHAWATAILERGAFMTFGMRMDVRRVPGATLRMHVKAAIEAEKLAEGRAFISKERKTEIKEREMLRLLARTVPTPTFVDIVLDVIDGRIYFASASKKAKEVFAALWHSSFDEVPLEQTPYVLAGNDFEPSGVDFLTMIRANGGLKNEAMTLEIESKATLHSGQTSMSVSSPDLGDVDNAVDTLPDRIQVSKARLRCVGDEEEFLYVLRGEDFGFSGLRTPKVDMKVGEGEDLDGPFLEKVYLISRCVNALHDAFRAFVKEYREKGPEVDSEGLPTGE